MKDWAGPQSIATSWKISVISRTVHCLPFTFVDTVYPAVASAGATDGEALNQRAPSDPRGMGRAEVSVRSAALSNGRTGGALWWSKSGEMRGGCIAPR